MLERYDAVIREQLQRGIVELVNDEASNTIKERIHYLPHHAVVREDKATSKVRIVYDASARSTGPSLNDCLHTGPSFGQFIFDILLRFRVHAVALAGDIEKAFLMIKVDERDRDVLRFLWIQNSNAQPVEVITLRFTHVVFGVNCSPFLLNATIRHHMETYKSTDPEFVKKFLLSIYVDDVSFGSDGVQSTYDLYMKAKSRLKEGGFLLRKFITNSEELRHLIATNEQLSEPLTNDTLVKEEDQSYTKCTLGTTAKSDGQHKILGVQWDYIRDQFVFGIDEVACQMKKVEPTRRNAVSLSARFFDPIGIVSPVIVLFKIFYQQLCAAKVGWDEPLKGELLKGWKSLCEALQSANVMTVPRCYHMITGTCLTARLIGFCDASSKAYAAVVYLRVEDDDDVSVTFVAAKTRVTPIKTISIPRLELLSALLLSRLVKNVEGALQSELRLNETICYTDSKVTLCWIQGKNHEWKQFVGNRVASIHTVVPPSNWYHCPGKENPADIPSRGMTPSELSQNTLWLSGPSWLQTLEGIAEGPDTNLVMPQECQLELKVTSVSNMLIATEDQGVNIAELINCERFSGTFRLLKTTVMVFRAVRNFLAKIGRTCQVIPNDRASEFDQARVIWLRQMQSQLQKCSKFSLWKQQFGLFVDELNLWRCGGRMGNSALAPAAKYPILLDKQHHLTRLIVMDAHKKVFHNGVRETLTELRASYWLVRGRQLVRKLIFSCVTCRKHEGQPYRAVPPPPLPEFQVTVSRPFEHTGVDFAGPLYVRRTENVKVWLCLYTCCTTRGVHLDLVENLDAATFIRSLKRFTSRRGIPVRIVSDNGSTFTAAAKVLKRMFTDPALEQHLLSCHMRWDFNLEKAPWWGGIFERLVKSTKRCLRKVIGTARLSYDELLTVVTEVEGVLNSRPLTYLSSEDVEEPLTPSHLMIGYRVMSLPDLPAVDFDDPTFNASPDNLRGRFKHLLIVTQRFWTRWRKEYLTELRESHRTLLARRKAADVVKNGEIVVIHDESLPRGQWRLGRIEQVIKGSDGHARGVRVRTQTKTGRPTVLQRPIQLIYPLEINGQPGSDDSRDIATTTAPDLSMDCAVDNSVTPGETRSRPQRAATVRAHGRIAEWMKD